MYSVLLTPAGFEAHPSSMTTAAAVGEAAEAEFSAARLDAALLARCDLRPVAAASPITAAERSAMMQESTKTSRLQPQIVRAAVVDLGSDGAAAAG